MCTFMVLAAIISYSPEAPDRWIPFPANPAWELYGKEDHAGVFRYTQTRRKAPTTPVLNLGVNLPPLTAGSPHETVMGTDPEAARLIISKPLRASKLCAHSDCPDGRCDRRKPRPPPAMPEFTLPQIQPLHIFGAVVGLAVSLLGLLILVLAVVLCIKLALYLTSGKAES